MSLKRLFSILILLLVSGCVTTPSVKITDTHWEKRFESIKAIDEWYVRGRIAIKTPEKNFSSNLSWHYQSDKQQFILFGAFGQTYAKLDSDKNHAQLTLSDEEKYYSQNIEQLLEEILGYPLPINQMRYWIMGAPTPVQQGKPLFNELGYLKSLYHEPWTINYKRYRQFENFQDMFLPSSINISKDRVSIKLSLRHWSDGSEL